jgi:hypothetical protein
MSESTQRTTIVVDDLYAEVRALQHQAMAAATSTELTHALAAAQRIDAELHSLHMTLTLLAATIRVAEQRLVRLQADPPARE